MFVTYHRLNDYSKTKKPLTYMVKGFLRELASFEPATSECEFYC